MVPFSHTSVSVVHRFIKSTIRRCAMLFVGAVNRKSSSTRLILSPHPRQDASG
jgi:hypothetical protein